MFLLHLLNYQDWGREAEEEEQDEVVHDERPWQKRGKSVKTFLNIYIYLSYVPRAYPALNPFLGLLLRSIRGIGRGGSGLNSFPASSASPVSSPSSAGCDLAARRDTILLGHERPFDRKKGNILKY